MVGGTGRERLGIAELRGLLEWLSAGQRQRHEPTHIACNPHPQTVPAGAVRRLTASKVHSCNTRAGIIGLANYLLVLIDVDESPELVDRARQLSAADPGAEFVLLAPATPPSPLDLLFSPSCTARRLASRRSQRVRPQLVEAGVRLVAARLGNFDPLCAVEDALRYTTYAALVVATPKHALLHLFHRDLACRIARRFPQVRVIHAAGVCLQPGATGFSATATRSRSPQRLQ